MKYERIKTLNKSSLQQKLLEYRKEHFNLRFQKALGELQNVTRIRVVKKSISRISTALNNK